MIYASTRGGSEVPSAEAVLTGLAPDGGLFVPTSFPLVTLDEIQRFATLSYHRLAAEILAMYLTDFSFTHLEETAKEAYASFSQKEVAPLVKIEKGLWGLELFHGPTSAFKDIALTLLPGLMKEAAETKGFIENSLILVATSGDTGKAALSGFQDKKGTAICVYYPKDGVSYVQRRQMTTQRGNNVEAIGVQGDFDACQRGVKELMGSRKMEKEIKKRGYRFSSANSINFGRLVPQVVYYFYSYGELLSKGEIELGEQVDFVVPTGNFGNILAGWYAKQMGLPVGKLWCASNANRVLTHFFQTGIYQGKGTLHRTISPSMDILVSSNLERLLYHAIGDPEQIGSYMKRLQKREDYKIEEEILVHFAEDFITGYVEEDDLVQETIRETFEETGYLLDPHSAVGKRVFDETTGVAKRKTVLVCTASPYKFAEDVLAAFSEDNLENNALQRLYDLTRAPVPEPLLEVLTLPERLTHQTEIAGMGENLLRWLDGERW